MSSSNIIGSELVQICVVVEDIDQTAAQYREILGFDVPSEYDYTRTADQTRSTYMGKPADVSARFVSFPLGRVSFELLQPLDETNVWMDFLKSHGPGIHHVTFNVPRTAAAAAAFADCGYKQTQQGLFTGRRGMYSYEDTEKTLGVTIEFLEYYDGDPEPTAPPFAADRGIGTGTVCQVGLVTPNIDETIARYLEVLNLSEPRRQQTPGYEITEMTFMGKPSKATAKLAFFDVGPQVQIELIEPDTTPSVWRNYLNDKGISTHHIAFQVKDTQKAVDHFAKYGIKVVQQATLRRSQWHVYLHGQRGRAGRHHRASGEFRRTPLDCTVSERLFARTYRGILSHLC